MTPGTPDLLGLGLHLGVGRASGWMRQSAHAALRVGTARQFKITNYATMSWAERVVAVSRPASVAGLWRIFRDGNDAGSTRQ